MARWRDACHYLKQQRLKVSKTVFRVLNLSLARAMGRWAEHVEEIVGMKQLGKRLVRRLQAFRLARSVDQLKIGVDLAKHAASAADSVGQFRTSNVVIRCMAAWKWAAERKKEVKSRYMQVRGKTTSMTSVVHALSAMVRWKDVVQKRATLRRKLAGLASRVLQDRHACLLAFALEHWCEAVDEIVAFRQQCGISDAYIRKVVHSLDGIDAVLEAGVEKQRRRAIDQSVDAPRPFFTENHDAHSLGFDQTSNAHGGIDQIDSDATNLRAGLELTATVHIGGDCTGLDWEVEQLDRNGLLPEAGVGRESRDIADQDASDDAGVHSDRTHETQYSCRSGKTDAQIMIGIDHTDSDTPQILAGLELTATAHIGEEYTRLDWEVKKVELPTEPEEDSRAFVDATGSGFNANISGWDTSRAADMSMSAPLDENPRQPSSPEPEQATPRTHIEEMFARLWEPRPD
eukprot:3939593-Rhodomonas_salina.1